MQKIIQILEKYPTQRTNEDIEYIYPLVKRIKLFEDQVTDDMLADETVRNVCKLMQFKFCKAGELVYMQGDPGEDFFIIFQGVAQVFVKES